MPLNMIERPDVEAHLESNAACHPDASAAALPVILMRAKRAEDRYP
jgi:hypothetical protein